MGPESDIDTVAMQAVVLFVLMLVAVLGLVTACSLLFGGRSRAREHSSSQTTADVSQRRRAHTPHPWQGFVDGAGFWVGGDLDGDGEPSDDDPDDER